MDVYVKSKFDGPNKIITKFKFKKSENSIDCVACCGVVCSVVGGWNRSNSNFINFFFLHLGNHQILFKAIKSLARSRMHTQTHTAKRGQMVGKELENENEAIIVNYGVE